MATRKSTLDTTTAANRLRELLRPGATVRTILRHRATSGMSRSISLIAVAYDATRGDVDIRELDYMAAAVLDDRLDDTHGGIRVSGAGMDMGFHLVYELSAALFPNGFDCTGERCPSSDHTNGDRDHAPHHHRDGGYALNHDWL